MYSQGEFANYESSGYCMYHQFNIQQFHILPTQCIYVFFCGSQNKQQLFPYTALTVWGLGAFAKLRRRTSSFIMSVRLSAWKNSTPTRRMFTKIDI